ncbi:MAG: M20/M25/M40 family metallo-hydrolase [Kiritimatiellae bacterium]|nr:M20/M25/M40 family metallo-hydrolase [Kiritimatiellia bacterium]
MNTKTLLLSAIASLSLMVNALDLDYLSDLIAIPSVSADTKEVNRSMQFTRDYLAKRGVYCTIETAPDGREILYAATTPGKCHDFVFSVHLDVVPAGKPDHFKLIRNGDRVEGRGTSDCKGNAASVVEILCKLAGKNYSVGCIFGPDEEIGGAGTKWMVDEMGYKPNKMAIVVDARARSVGYAHKGQTYVKISAKGRSGHSSRPWTCDDSITKVTLAYAKIREIWDQRHPLPEDKWSDVMVPTFIKADSGALNLIPSTMELILNLRSVNPGATDELVKLAKEVAVGCDVELMRYSPPVNTDPNHPLMESLRKAIEDEAKTPISFSRMVAATDARWFVSRKIPIALIGAAGGGAHAVYEYKSISSLEEMERYLLKFIESNSK